MRVANGAGLLYTEDVAGYSFTFGLLGGQMGSTLDPQLLHHSCCSMDRAERADAYQQLGEFLLRVAHSRLRSKPDLHPRAEECAQEALVTVWQKLEAGQGPDDPERFLGWSARIVIRRVYDMLRRLGFSTSSRDIDGEEAETRATALRRKRVPREKQESFEQLDAYDDGTTAPREERVPDAMVVDPEANVLEREGLIELLLGVHDHQRLSNDSKQVLMYGFLEGLTDEELASRLNTKKSNVHVIRSRDLSRLRDDTDFMEQLRDHYT